MYKVVQGREIKGDDPSDPNKIPKTANDLQHPVYALSFRLKVLESLSRAREYLQNLETSYIFVPVQTTSDQLPEIHRRLQNIRERIKTHNLRVPCESKKCLANNPAIYLYLNRCETCEPENNAASVDELNMRTFRNVINRLLFLEEKISSSLSNQLTLEELETFIAESQKLASIIL